MDDEPASAVRGLAHLVDEAPDGALARVCAMDGSGLVGDGELPHGDSGQVRGIVLNRCGRRTARVSSGGGFDVTEYRPEEPERASISRSP